MTCKDCVHYEVCKDDFESGYLFEDNNGNYFTDDCDNFKNKADFVEVVRCGRCKYSRELNKNKSPEKYYKNCCVVCECEDIVGDEPMIYHNEHFCGKGEIHNE